MKRKITLGILSVIVLMIFMAIPVMGTSDMDYFNITISGIENYDEITEELAILNRERAAFRLLWA